MWYEPWSALLPFSYLVAKEVNFWKVFIMYWHLWMEIWKKKRQKSRHPRCTVQWVIRDFPEERASHFMTLPHPLVLRSFCQNQTGEHVSLLVMTLTVSDTSWYLCFSRLGWLKWQPAFSWFLMPKYQRVRADSAAELLKQQLGQRREQRCLWPISLRMAWYIGFTQVTWRCRGRRIEAFAMSFLPPCQRSTPSKNTVWLSPPWAAWQKHSVSSYGARSLQQPLPQQISCALNEKQPGVCRLPHATVFPKTRDLIFASQASATELINLCSKCSPLPLKFGHLFFKPSYGTKTVWLQPKRKRYLALAQQTKTAKQRQEEMGHTR